MIRKIFSFALLTAVASVGAAAQTPAPQSKPEPRVFAWSFDSDGGYLGIQTEEISRENISKFGLRDVRGVGVAKVMEGSPAEAAGLQVNDVIVRINGEDITSSRKLTRLIGEISPDHTARITVLRGGSEREITATLGKRPAPKFGEGSFPRGFEKLELPDMPGLDRLQRMEIPTSPGAPDAPHVFSFSSKRQIGVGLTPLTKQLSDHFGVTNGALINTVREDSPAARAGLKAGDVIVEVDGKAVKGEWDLIRAIGEKKEGDISLTIVRGRDRQTIRVTPEDGKGRFESFFELRSMPSPPDAPSIPDAFRFERAVPSAPVPLNHLLMPGRII